MTLSKLETAFLRIIANDPTCSRRTAMLAARFEVKLAGGYAKRRTALDRLFKAGLVAQRFASPHARKAVK